VSLIIVNVTVVDKIRAEYLEVPMEEAKTKQKKIKTEGL
jgi:hypothetical protein